MAIITHITTIAAWTAARTAGTYAPPSLKSEGFVHLSTPEQVAATASRYFTGQTDLILLVFEEVTLSATGEGKLRFEAPAPLPTSTTTGQGHPNSGSPAPARGLFPHYYGPIDPAWAIAAIPMPPLDDGRFVVPRQLWKLGCRFGGLVSHMPAIAVVTNSVSTPMDFGWGEIESRIELSPEYAGALLGLDDFSHALVLTWLDGANYTPERHLQRRPRGRDDMPMLGILAQRAKDRPSPIGVTAVPIVGVEGEVLVVRGLDAIDGTPVLDIKPYVAAFDAPEGAEIPQWMVRLMGGYF